MREHLENKAYELCAGYNLPVTQKNYDLLTRMMSHNQTGLLLQQHCKVLAQKSNTPGRLAMPLLGFSETHYVASYPIYSGLQ